MLSKKYRLTKDYDFQRVKKYGQRTAGKQFVLSWAANKFEFSRFGFIGSKKLAKAAKRHRAIRLLRESIRLSLPKIRPGFDVVIIARSGILGRTFEEVNREMQRLLGKVQLIKPD